MKELTLVVSTDPDGSFEVYRKLQLPGIATCTVIIVDYNWTPWHREGENLLW